ncbi:hypothetical protein ACX0G7_09580 [Flavitalea antarctica]
MNKLFLYISLLICFSSCITERKAVKYMKDHANVSSAYCATEYPVKESTTVIVVEDTAKARRVKDSLSQYAEKWVKIAQERNLSLDAVDEFVTELVAKGELQEIECNATVRSIQAKLASVPKVDIIALRKSIAAELQRQIIPCKDSIITNEIENTAKTEVFKIKLDEVAQELHTNVTWKKIWMYLAIFFFIVCCLQHFLGKKEIRITK